MSDALKQSYCLALDAMGGDNAPHSVIAGAALCNKKHPDVNFIFFGDEDKLTPLLEKFPKLQAQSKIEHTIDVISCEEKPSIAVRKGRKSSMTLAINAVKDGRADAVVSAGNTGALMAISKLALRPLEDIDRPAICTFMPTRKNGNVVLLDMGANATCDAENLAQFAIMGDAFAKAALNVSDPKIGVLNIGSEELKGHETVRVAHQILSEEYTHINYSGYVEGDQIMSGDFDVVVTDGFTGNVTLKAIEGTAKLITSKFKHGFKRSIFGIIGLLIAFFPLRKIFKNLDPRKYNGAMFLGLNGISVKSHGNADKVSFCNALEVTINLIENKINEKIIEELKFNNNSSSS